MTPDLIIRAGRLLFGGGLAPGLASTLGVSPETVKQWLAKRRSIPPDVRALLIAAMRQRRQELADMEEELASGMGALHGLSPRQTAKLGWLHSGAWLLDAEWCGRQTRKSLRDATAIVLADIGPRMASDDGEPEALLAALSRLTDRQARDVASAARAMDELGLITIPPR